MANSDKKREIIKKEFASIDKRFLSTIKVDDGNRAYYEKNYVNAVKCYSEALKLDNNSVDAYYNRGIAYIKQKNINKQLLILIKLLN